MPKLKGGRSEKWAIGDAYFVRTPTAMDALNR
jgi:hypothetical protein